MTPGVIAKASHSMGEAMVRIKIDEIPSCSASLRAAPHFADIGATSARSNYRALQSIHSFVPIFLDGIMSSARPAGPNEAETSP